MSGAHTPSEISSEGDARRETIMRSIIESIKTLPEKQQEDAVREMSEIFQDLKNKNGMSPDEEFAYIHDLIGRCEEEKNLLFQIGFPAILEFFQKQNALERFCFYFFASKTLEDEFPEFFDKDRNKGIEKGKNKHKNVLITVQEDGNENGNENGDFQHLLLRWKTKLFVQLWLQEKSVYFYSTINNLLSYTTILISTGSSATLFSTESTTTKYVIGALTMTTGILTAFSRQLKPAEKYQEHLLTTTQYHVLMRKMDSYISLPDTDTTSEKFREEIETEMNQLLQKQLNPPLFIRYLFQKKYGSIDSMMYGNEILNLMMKESLASKFLEYIKTELKKKVKSVRDIQQMTQKLAFLQNQHGVAPMPDSSLPSSIYNVEEPAVERNGKDKRKSWFRCA